MISVSQIKAARGLLDWSQSKLAEKCGLTQRTLTNIETSRTRPSQDTLAAIKNVFERSGVEFIEDGVRQKKRQMDIIKGKDFSIKFMDHLFETLVETKSKEVLLNGINSRLLEPHVREKVKDYKNKIKLLGITERRLVPEDIDYGFIENEPEQYRGLPWKYFSDTTPTFIFADCYAIMMFDIQEVWIIKNKALAEFQRKQFELLWKTAKIFTA